MGTGQAFTPKKKRCRPVDEASTESWHPPTTVRNQLWLSPPSSGWDLDESQDAQVLCPVQPPRQKIADDMPKKDATKQEGQNNVQGKTKATDGNISQPPPKLRRSLCFTEDMLP